MTTSLHINRKKWVSNSLLLVFTVLVIFSGFLSEMLKAPIKNSSEIIEQSLVFKNKELDLVNKISLKNKAGEFIFERANLEDKSLWNMTSPKTVASSSVLIEKLFNSLNRIKTKKLIPDTKTNSLNFSLEKPTATLTLTDKNQKTYLVEIGLINTIDQSTYIRISGRNGIFHVEAPSESLENLTLDNFIEATIFQFPIQDILSFKISKKGFPLDLINLTKKENHWIAPDGKMLNVKKTEDFISEFFKIKSSFVLDQQSELQKKQSQKLMASPDFKVNIETADGKKLIYAVSMPVKSLVDKALNDELHVLINESQSSLFYIVKKENLNLMDVKPDLVKSFEEELKTP